MNEKGEPFLILGFFYAVIPLTIVLLVIISLTNNYSFFKNTGKRIKKNRLIKWFVNFLNNKQEKDLLNISIQTNKEIENKIKLLEQTDLKYELNQNIIVNLASKLSHMNCRSNKEVFGIGDNPKRLYFIIEGYVDIFSQYNAKICSLNKHNFFGEVEHALQLDKRCFTVVTGDKPCSFLTLKKDAFDEMMLEKSFNKIIMETAKQRYQILVATGFIDDN